MGQSRVVSSKSNPCVNNYYECMHGLLYTYINLCFALWKPGMISGVHNKYHRIHSCKIIAPHTPGCDISANKCTSYIPWA